jgi:uncharacterized protein YutE (UPF0331/DUF86 family)
MDKALIEQKLESLRRCLARIEQKLPSTPEALALDVDAQDILSLNLTRAVQVCVDMASHWLSEHGEVRSPHTMGQSFEALAAAGVIDAALAERLRKSVGFRNLVVHNDETVDWAIVHAVCQHRLVDFRQFGATMAALLA